MSLKRLNSTTRFTQIEATNVLHLIYTVPVGKVALIKEILLKAGSTPTAYLSPFEIYLLPSGGTDAGADADILALDIDQGATVITIAEVSSFGTTNLFAVFARNTILNASDQVKIKARAGGTIGSYEFTICLSGDET